MVARRLVVGSGRCGRVPDVDVATLTSAPGGRDRQRAKRPAPSTGAGSRCRSTRSARWVAGVVGKGGDHQEGVGQHGKGDPPVPAAPTADLVLVQATKALAGTEIRALLRTRRAKITPAQAGLAVSGGD